MSGQNKLDNFNLLESVASNAISGVGSIVAAKPVAKYFSGARCILRVNGNILAFATGISWTIHTEAEEITTIDSYMPHELAPNRVKVNGTISGLRIPGNGPGYNLMQANMLNFAHQKYIDIEVRDSQTDNLIFQTNKALITRRSESVRSEGMAEMTLDFMAIGFIDEVVNPAKPG